MKGLTPTFRAGLWYGRRRSPQGQRCLLLLEESLPGSAHQVPELGDLQTTLSVSGFADGEDRQRFCPRAGAEPPQPLAEASPRQPAPGCHAPPPPRQKLTPPTAQSFCHTTLQLRRLKYFRHICVEDQQASLFLWADSSQPGTALTPNSPLLLTEGLQ